MTPPVWLRQRPTPTQRRAAPAKPSSSCGKVNSVGLPSGRGTWRARLASSAAGATIIAEPADKPYGGRGYAVRDPEGHIWSFGSYDPWA